MIIRASKVFAWVVALPLLLVSTLSISPAFAQDEMTPSVTVNDQALEEGTVIVEQVISQGPGWIVIHAQQNDAPGPVIGHAAVEDGVNENVTVEIDAEATTETLYAMLHTDAGDVGTYEFPGPDSPVPVDGEVVTPSFMLEDSPQQEGTTGETAEEIPIYQKSPWWPYLTAHIEDDDPPAIAGGPINLHIVQESGGLEWALPAQRELDPTIFGTEGNPQGTEVPPILIGVPLEMREVMTDGTFITAGMTPFGDAFASTRGQLDLRLTDATATDAAVTDDTIDLTATFQAPMNQGTYSVTVDTVNSHGWFYPTAGGVATNYIQHGITGWGTRLMPTQFVYAGFWGTGDLYHNGELVDEDRLVHGMLTEYVRKAPYDLVFDEEVNPGAWHFHLIMPPFTEQGMPRPLQTGFELPNGEMQPFLHVMFPNIEILQEDEMDREEAVPATEADAEEAGVEDDAELMQPERTDQEMEGDDEQGEAAGAEEAMAAPEPEMTVDVQAMAMRFVPGTEEPITVPQGVPVQFVVESVDIFHTFTVAPNEDAEPIFSLELFPDEEPSEIVWIFEEAGEYYLYCKPHEGLGMTGTIVVEASE